MILKTKPSTIQSLFYLKPYLKPHFKLIFSSALLAIPLAALRLGPAPVVRYVLDDLLHNKDPKRLFLYPVIIIGLYALNFVVRFTHYYLLKTVIIRVNQSLKNNLFRHLLGLSADYFTAQSTGTLISRTSLDPQAIDAGLSCINVVIREPLTLCFLLIYACTLNWQLTLITLITVPILAWIFKATARNLKRYISSISQVNARLISTLQESFTGIRVIKMFGLEDHVFQKFAQRNEEVASWLLKTSLLEETSHPLVEFVTAAALAPLVALGAQQVMLGQMSEGRLFAFFTTFALMMSPIRLMNDVNIKLNQAAAACDRIFEIFSWKSHLHEPKHPKLCQDLEHSIELKDVFFAYPDNPNRYVLKNVSFTLARGKIVAIVGASGAGKSSLVSLLPRIFDINHGSILLDGQDIRSLSLENLRKMISVVSQDIFLFNDSITENIACGNLKSDAQAIREAAQRAHALDFIEALPEQFQTNIGDRGQKLSGGERQRISIARAFLRQAPILILDEATSNLDSASERAVQVALDELMQNRTTIIIAHRLSTIQNADLILVMKDGEIVERGSHHNLLSLQGEYARFYSG